MHIGFFSPTWPPGNHTNGIVTYVYFMKAALERQGHRVSVISANELNINFQRYLTELSAIESFLIRLDRRFQEVSRRRTHLLQRSTYELGRYVEHLHQQDPFDIFEIEETFGLANDVIKRLPNATVVRTHGPHFVADRFSDLPGQKDATQRIKAEAQVMRQAAGLTSPSDALLREITKDLGSSEIHSKHIFNPLNIDDTGIQNQSSNDTEILFVGRFDRPKGADICLEAFEVAARKMPDLRLTMVGPDPGLKISTGETLDFLQYCNRFVSAEVRSRIQFCGRLSSPEVNALRQRAALVVFPSRYEVFPYSIAESMLLGKLVIASETTGAKELITNFQTGVLVPNSNAPALGDAIVQYISNPHERKRIGSAAKDWCFFNLNPDKIATRTVAFYESIAA